MNNDKIISIENNNFTPIDIFVIIIFLTADYASIILYGIEIKSIKYIINYPELIIINATIIGIFTLIILLSKRIETMLVCIFSFFIYMLILYIYHGDSENILVETLLLSLLIFSILIDKKSFKERKLNYIKEDFIIISIISIFIFIILIGYYINLNNNWEKVIIKNKEFSFQKYNTFQMTFKQKIFSTNRLENLQNNITFKNSELYIEQLQENGILNQNSNSILYNNKNIFATYLENEKYKTFFIVNKKYSIFDNTTKMYIIFTEKYQNIEEYKIIDILEKKLTVENLDKE